jgi:hypothetical protein
MICCRSLETSAAMTAEEEMSRQYFAVVYGASYAAPFSATIPFAPFGNMKKNK